MTQIPQTLTKRVQDKFQIIENTLTHTPKDNPKDLIQIEIGDAKQPDFKPQVKIMRWDNEVNFSMRAKEHPQAIVEIKEEKIKYITPEYEVHQYDKPEAGEDGGFEFEWILPSKSSSNVLTATIQTKGLNFFYQPQLTQEEINEGSSRPENVVGSYAVYHKTKGGMNDIAGMEYKAGKAFHIYRPKVTDANGVETWGELNIDEQNGLLTVTIDQTWLDNAVYPVIVDPTFGYTSVGGGTLSRTNDSICYKATIPEAGTLDSVSAYIENLTGTNNYKGGVFLDSTDAKIAEGSVVGVGVAGWHVSNCASESLNASTTYQIAYWAGTTTNGHRIYRDVGGSSDNNFDGMGALNPTSDPYPDPYGVEGQTENKYSIYATYTISDNPTGVTLCIFKPRNSEFPATNFSTHDTRNSHPCLDFDTTTQETSFFEGVMPRSYSGGDITIYIHFSASSATSGSGSWGISFERIGDGQQDIDSDGFASEVLTGQFLVSSTSGHVMIANTTLTNAECDGITIGEKFRLRIRRDVTNDTAAGDLELLGIELREAS